MLKVQSCTEFLVFFYSNTAPRSASHSQSCWTDGYSHGLCCDIGILGPLNKDNIGATEDPANEVSFRGRLGKSMTLKKDPNRASEEYIVKFEYSSNSYKTISQKAWSDKSLCYLSDQGNMDLVAMQTVGMK